MTTDRPLLQLMADFVAEVRCCEPRSVIHRSIPGKDWDKKRDPETASRAVKEYLATLDDAAFGVASTTSPFMMATQTSPPLGSAVAFATSTSPS